MALALSTTLASDKVFRVGGMEFSWLFQGQEIFISLSAPTQGWLAIAFNNRPGLAGTNLIMARVVAGHTEISDRTIVAPGDHRAVKSVGGVRSVRLVAGEEGKSTRVEFVLPMQAVDRFHYSLRPGRKVFVTLAHSRDKDFAHHSVWRATFELEL